MKDFRDRLLGVRPVQDRLLLPKPPPRPDISRAAEEESFASIEIKRDAVRVANHRSSDRHRLDSETVEILHDGRSQLVGLVNLSGGGAMIDGAEGLQLWDEVRLRFAECGEVDAAVRWVRGNRHGLEFAEETRIDTGQEELADVLRAVIARSYPDIALETLPGELTGHDNGSQLPDCATPAAQPDKPQDTVEREIRHPLIWSGQVHHDHDTHQVRLRNISAGGALIECNHPFKVGAELMLDLDEAGIIFARVSWAQGGAAGLKFQTPFDLRQLAQARPEVAVSRWVAPDYLREVPRASSPWRSQWGSTDRGTLQRRPGSIRRA